MQQQKLMRMVSKQQCYSVTMVFLAWEALVLVEGIPHALMLMVMKIKGKAGTDSDTISWGCKDGGTYSRTIWFPTMLFKVSYVIM